MPSLNHCRQRRSACASPVSLVAVSGQEMMPKTVLLLLNSLIWVEGKGSDTEGSPYYKHCGVDRNEEVQLLREVAIPVAT